MIAVNEPYKNHIKIRQLSRIFSSNHLQLKYEYPFNDYLNKTDKDELINYSKSKRKFFSIFPLFLIRQNTQYRLPCWACSLIYIPILVAIDILHRAHISTKRRDVTIFLMCFPWKPNTVFLRSLLFWTKTGTKSILCEWISFHSG